MYGTAWKKLSPVFWGQECRDENGTFEKRAGKSFQPKTPKGLPVQSAYFGNFPVLLSEQNIFHFFEKSS